MKSNAFFKDERIMFLSKYMHQTVKMIMDEMLEWCDENLDHAAIVTDTLSRPEDDKKLKRVSSTHREGRAFDISLREWTSKEVTNFCEYFEMIYGHLGAVSSSSGKSKLIVVHDAGSGMHLHIQLNKAFAVKVDWSQIDNEYSNR
jgi:hypothetical protein